MARQVADETTSFAAAPSTARATSYQSIATSSISATPEPQLQHQPPHRSPSPDGDDSHWWQRLSAIELENKGSVARDHLALERTFLAWLRTSLAFASIGIAVTQLFRLNTAVKDVDKHGASAVESTLRHVGKPLGGTFLGIAIMVLIIGVNRYFESQAWLLKGKFPASRGSIFLLTFVAGALIVSSLAVILAIAPSQFET